MPAPTTTLLLQIEPVITQICEGSNALLAALRGKTEVPDTVADKVFTAYNTLGVALEDVKSAKRAVTASTAGGARRGKTRRLGRRGNRRN